MKMCQLMIAVTTVSKQANISDSKFLRQRKLWRSTRNEDILVLLILAVPDVGPQAAV